MRLESVLVVTSRFYLSKNSLVGPPSVEIRRGLPQSEPKYRAVDFEDAPLVSRSFSQIFTLCKVDC